jgi:proline dehydrogenase
MNISKNIFEDTATAYTSKSNGDLHKAKVMFELMSKNSLVKLGSSVASFALALHLPVSTLFRYTVYNHFCGGETFDECKETINELGKSNVGVLLNFGVELKETEEDFDKTIAHNVEALEFAGKNRLVKALCIKLTGFGRFALFEKIQNSEELTATEQKEFGKIRKRFEHLCEVAEKNKVALYVDAEESWIQNPLDELVEEMMQQFNKKSCIVYNTFQMYRWDRLEYLNTQIVKAKSGGYFLGAKLVRGAYMEKERERALAVGYKSPIHQNKKGVDKDFNEAVNICLDNLKHVYTCIASQSEQSNLLAIQLVDKKGIDRNSEQLWFSQLYGMGDNITFNLAKFGFNATKYLPYGPVRDVIPYLIRRAQENTSVSGQTTRELSLIVQEIKRRKS